MRKAICFGALLWVALHSGVLWAQEAPVPDRAADDSTASANTTPTATGRVGESVLQLPTNAPPFMNHGGDLGDVRVSVLGQRRQIPNPNGIELQVEIVSHSNQPIALDRLVDSLQIAVRNQRDEVLQLPPVAYELTRWGQGYKPKTPVLPYKLLSLASNGRVLTDEELKEQFVVLEPMGHLTIRLTIPRVKVIVPGEFEPMGPMYKKQEDGTPYMQPKTREDVLPPGVYTILSSVGLAEDLTRPDNPHPRPRFVNYRFFAPREPEKRLVVDYTTPGAVTEVKAEGKNESS